MRVSITVTDYCDRAGPAALAGRLAEVVGAADQTGIDTVWVADHLLQADPSHSVDEPMLEAFTTLGYLAHASTRVRLGTMVAAASYRAPALLIKAVTTLDVLSGGRAWLGLGAGYQQDEARAMGLQLAATPAERFARLAETLAIAEQLFVDDPTPHHGQYYRLERPVNHPQPLSRPRPPILIGGAGERQTLRLVARHADACNLFDVPDGGATLTHKLAVLRQHCADAARDPDTIDRTVSVRWAESHSAAELAAHCADLAELGLTHVVLLRPGPWTATDVAALSEVVAAVGD